jgi:hypothetical protein
MFIGYSVMAYLLAILSYQSVHFFTG